MTNSFSQYLTSILTLGACAFICESICSSFSQSKALSKGLGLISSLCIFTAIILPLSAILKSCEINTDFKYSKEEYYTNENLLEEFTEKDTESALSSLIFEKSGIQVAFIGIDLNIYDAKNKAQTVNIGLYEKDLKSEESLRTLLLEKLGSDTTINIFKVENERE